MIDHDGKERTEVSYPSIESMNAKLKELHYPLFEVED